MKTKIGAILFLSFLLAPVFADEPTSLGYHKDTQIIPREDEEICPGATLLQHDNGTFENGYCWAGGRCKPPDYGAWAQCYDADYVCGIQFLFTQIGDFAGQTMDVYVWDYDADGNNPPGPDSGNVLSALRNIDVENVAFWPLFSTHNVQVCCVTNGLHFVGFWGNWPNQVAAWYIAGDENGSESLGIRTRWNLGAGEGGDWIPIRSFFGNCLSIGIREYSGVSICHSAGVPDPERHETTWGAIKSFY